MASGRQSGPMVYAAPAAPSAGLFFCQVSSASGMLGGYYDVAVTIYIDGTASAAVDDDNIALFVNGGGFTTLPCPSNGTVCQYDFVIRNDGSVPANFVALNVIMAASAGTVYHGLIECTLRDDDD